MFKDFGIQLQRRRKDNEHEDNQDTEQLRRGPRASSPNNITRANGSEKIPELNRFPPTVYIKIFSKQTKCFVKANINSKFIRRK